ncbi:unnamed protein product, partial [Meganyctiphanes norvegica]
HGMEAFKKDFYTLVWCTYRRQFPTLQDSSLTTDCGWGCMLRSGQMMLAHALTRHFLSRDWRHSKSEVISHSPEEVIHRCVVRWFGDSPSSFCPLSLHNLVHFGQKLGKCAGDWYGPASVAYIFKEAVEMGSRYIPELQRVSVYVAQDCAVYIQDVLDLGSVSECVCNKGNLSHILKETQLYKKQCSFNGAKVKKYKGPRVSKGGNLAHFRAREMSKTMPKDPQSPEINIDGRNGQKLGDMVRTISNDISESEVNSIVTFPENEKFERLQSSSNSKRVKLKNTLDYASRSNNEECSICNNWRSVVIMVPVRLGGEGLNPIYAQCIYAMFTHDLFIGIIGGRPKHSLYFVGFQDESLIHLDPHLCQDAVPVTQPSFPLSSYHCSSPRKMSLSRMDPSATLGFYCHTREDFYRLIEDLPEIVTPKISGFEYPIFEFVDGRSSDADEACTRQVSHEDKMAASLPKDTPLMPQDSEEFVFL